MIRRVVLRHFKRFQEVTFQFPGHVVIAGPNNTGKTTVLQAVAAWALAYAKWRELNNFRRGRGGYAWAPIARQAFSAVPLRTYDLLWNQRRTGRAIEIEIADSLGAYIAMELRHDSTEQIKVRPHRDTKPETVRGMSLDAVFVPPMTGLSTEEPLYARTEYLDAMLSQARPGEVLRNLLVQAHRNEEAWRFLQGSILRLFDYELLPPDDAGPHILAEYRSSSGGPHLDIASAGSGFQQVLMLLTFLATRPGAVLLLDEPDAHLHVILQDAIYNELRSVAARQGSQLVIATHSEVVINAVDPSELCVIFQRPRLLATAEEKKALIRSLGILTNTDLMLAEVAPGVLYVEDYPDLEILRAWAKVLDHPALPLLTTRLYWRKSVSDARRGGSGFSSREHYEALKLVREDLPGLEILDRDGNPNLPEREPVGEGLQRLRWRYYEIESYLVHPQGLERFLEQQLGPGALSMQAKQDLRDHLEDLLQASFLQDPFHPTQLVDAYLSQTKARTRILPDLLEAAGLPGFPYTRYHEIAAAMAPEDVHPEAVEKLDAICRAFGQ